MGNKTYSDSYLMSLTKAQIIELLRAAEHNFFATEEALNNSVKAGMEIAEKYDKAKELLKAAVEDMNDNNICDESKICKVCISANKTTCPDIFRWQHTDEALELIGDKLE